MKTVRKKRDTALTLVEVMVAILVIVVAVIGAMGYRYYCALDARKADVHITAGRLGWMLLEAWKGTGGSLDESEHDPTALAYPPQLLIDIGSGPDVPVGFTLRGSYRIVAGVANYYATLSYKDEVENRLRVLNVCVAWPKKYPTGAYEADDRTINLTTKAMYAQP